MGKILWIRPDHRWKYGACALHAGYIRLKTHTQEFVDPSWNVMAHGDAWEGKWSGNCRMEWVASTLHTTSEHGVSSITTADAHTSAVPVVDWTDAPADLNGLVRFAERRNLFSARVPSHFNWPLQFFKLGPRWGWVVNANLRRFWHVYPHIYYQKT